MSVYVLDELAFWKLRAVAAERAAAVQQLELLAQQAKERIGDLQDKQNALVAALGAAHGFDPQVRAFRLVDESHTLHIEDAPAGGGA